MARLARNLARAMPRGLPPRRGLVDANPRSSGAQASVGWTGAKTIRLVTSESPVNLELGGRLGPIDVEYETYCQLSANQDNARLVAHALSGDAHAAGWDKETKEVLVIVEKQPSTTRESP